MVGLDIPKSTLHARYGLSDPIAFLEKANVGGGEPPHVALPSFKMYQIGLYYLDVPYTTNIRSVSRYKRILTPIALNP